MGSFYENGNINYVSIMSRLDWAKSIKVFEFLDRNGLVCFYVSQFLRTWRCCWEYSTKSGEKNSTGSCDLSGWIRTENRRPRKRLGLCLW